MKILTLDIETLDPDLAKGGYSRGYVWHTDFRLLDVGVLWEDVFYTFQDVKELNSFLVSIQEPFKILCHNGLYDIPILVHFGLDLKKYKYTDTMILSSLANPLIESQSLAYLTNFYKLEIKKLTEFVDEAGNSIDYYKDKMNVFKVQYPDVYYQYLEQDLRSTYELYLVLLETLIKIDKRQQNNLLSYQKETILSVLTTEEELLPLVVELNMIPKNIDQTKLENAIQKAKQDREAILDIYRDILTFPSHLYEKPKISAKNKNKPLKKISKDDQLDLVDFIEGKIVDDKNPLEDFIHNWKRHIEVMSFTYPNFELYWNEVFSAINLLENGTIKISDFLNNAWIKPKDKPSLRGFQLLFELYFKPTEPKKYTTSTGMISLSKGVIKLIEKEDLCEQAKFLFDYVQKLGNIDKLISSYLEPFPKMIKDTGALYSNIYPYKTGRGGTSSGRFSSSNFNIQQLPKKKNDIYGIKSMFCAREGYKLISIDYQQQEYRLFVHASNSKSLIEAYEKNPKADIHSVIAGLIWNYEEDKKKESDIYVEGSGYVSESDRGRAKNFTFGTIYGATVFKLSEMLSCSMEEATTIYDKIHGIIPDFKSLYKKIIDYAVDSELTSNIYGRVMKEVSIDTLDVFIENFRTFVKQTQMGDSIDYMAVLEYFEETNDIFFNIVSTSFKEDDFKDFYNKFNSFSRIPDIKDYEYFNETMWESYLKRESKEPFIQLLILLQDKLKCFRCSENTFKKLALLIHTRLKSNIFKSEDYNARIKKEIKSLNETGTLTKGFNIFYRLVKIEKYEYFIKQLTQYFVFAWVKNRYKYLKKQVNFICQSSGADIVKKALVKFYKEDFSGFDCRIITTVHDEILFEVKDDEKLKECVTYLKNTMEVSFQEHTLLVPMLVDVKISKYWGGE